MPKLVRLLTTFVAICLLLLTPSMSANAESRPHPESVFLTNNPGKIAGITIGLVAVGAAIGLGIYYGVYHKPSLTGCAVATPDGLTIKTDSNQSWMAIGAIEGIKAGDRVKVAGKKQKHDPSKRFVVEKLAKDYGPCQVTP